MAGKVLSIKYVADASSLKSTLAQIDRAHATLGQKMQTLGRSMYSTGRSATIGLTLPIVAGFKTAIDEATQFNQVQAQTNAALKSTGGAANVTAGHIDGLSTKLGALTAQDAEVVHSMENILLTFPALRNEVGKGNQIFDQASLAVANLSARMGTDLNSAATFVGKALGNPIKGLTSLTRVGVEFDDQQIKMITHLVNTGNVMGAQKVILAELSKEFGGSAKAMGDAASPLTKLNLAFRDFAQKIGPTVIRIVEQITGWLSKLMKWFENLSPGVQHFAVVVAALTAAFGPLLIVLGALARSLGFIFSAVEGGALLFAKLGGAVAVATPEIEGAAAATAGASAAFSSLAAPIAAAAVVIGIAVVKTISMNSAMKEAEDRIRIFGTESANTAGDVDYLNQRISRANGAVGGLADRFDLTHQSGQKYTNTIEKAAAAHRKFIRDTLAATEAQATFNQIMQSAHGVTAKQGEAIARLVEKISEYGGHLTKAQKIELEMDLAFGRTGDAVKLLQGKIDDLQRHIDHLHGRTLDIRVPISGALSAISILQRAIDTLHGHTIHFGGLGGGPRKYQGGTSFHPGGMALVGEAGAELLDLPRGSRVHSAGETSRMLGGTTVIVNVGGSVVSERDLVEVVRKGLKQVGNRNGGRTGL